MLAGNLTRLGAVAIAGVALAMPASAVARGSGSLSCSSTQAGTVLSFSLSPGHEDRVSLASDGGAVGMSRETEGLPPGAYGCGGGDQGPAVAVSGHLGDRDDVVLTSSEDFALPQGQEEFDPGPLDPQITLNLDGGGGDDRIDGHPGDGVIDGGPGKDTIVDPGGADVLRGGAGSDRIVARDGEKDLIRCGAGDDNVKADDKDVLRSC